MLAFQILIDAIISKLSENLVDAAAAEMFRIRRIHACSLSKVTRMSLIIDGFI